VIHCDIKPANIYMIGRTQPKLLDFGIARVAQQQGQPDGAAMPLAAGDSLGGTSLPPAELGSPYYVAPEQLRGEPLDLRCDVYGVGVVLYELLTGRRAFEGRSLEGIRKAVLEANVPTAASVNRNVNAGLSAIVARAMARNPAQRYRSARQFARALRGWLEEEASRQAAAPLGRSNWAWGVFAGLGLAAAAAFGWLSLSDRNGTSSPEARLATVPAVVAIPAAVAAVPSVALQASNASAVVAAAPASAGAVVKSAKTETAETSRARERRVARELAAAAPPATAAAVVTVTQGVVQLAISPWGQVEVNGVAAGTTPPLSRLTLPAGKHQVVVRNDEFPPFSVTVTVDEDKPVTLRHRFGS
jgi:serine/threonine-protein kinase